MSGWDSWVDFIVGEADEEYRSECLDPGNDGPVVFHIRLGGKEGGGSYAQSADWDIEMESGDVAKLCKQSAGEETDIFENAPKGFLVFSCIPCTISGVSISVVVGSQKRQKDNSARPFFASVSNTCSVMALVDNSRGNSRAEVLNAFAHGVVKLMENGI